MLLLASQMGLRCCEISRLHANDLLDTAEVPMVLIHGQGAKDRSVPLHPLVMAVLGPLPSRGWLFRRPDGSPLSPAQVSIAMREHLRDHGIDATGHQLRTGRDEAVPGDEGSAVDAGGVGPCEPEHDGDLHGVGER